MTSLSELKAKFRTQHIIFVLFNTGERLLIKYTVYDVPL